MIGGKLRGSESLQRFLQTLSRQVPERVADEVERAGRTVEAEAKSTVAKDTGKLQQMIYFEATRGGNGAKITAGTPYAAYIEFGTGGSVLIPPGWEDLAAQFKGSGGKRTISLPPRPYLLPAFRREGKELEMRLNTWLRARL